MVTDVFIVGGGPAGNSAATHAARLGADVTLVERDVIGGAAHLWDCIPSKAMIATGGAMSFARRSELFGLQDAPDVSGDDAERRSSPEQPQDASRKPQADVLSLTGRK